MSDPEMHQQIFAEKFEALCVEWVRRLRLGNWAIEYEMGDVVDGDGTIEAQCHVNTHLGHAAKIRFSSPGNM